MSSGRHRRDPAPDEPAWDDPGGHQQVPQRQAGDEPAWDDPYWYQQAQRAQAWDEAAWQQAPTTPAWDEAAWQEPAPRTQGWDQPARQDPRWQQQAPTTPAWDEPAWQQQASPTPARDEAAWQHQVPRTPAWDQPAREDPRWQRQAPRIQARDEAAWPDQAPTTPAWNQPAREDPRWQQAPTTPAWDEPAWPHQVPRTPARDQPAWPHQAPPTRAWDQPAREDPRWQQQAPRTPARDQPAWPDQAPPTRAWDQPAREDPRWQQQAPRTPARDEPAWDDPRWHEQPPGTPARDEPSGQPKGRGARHGRAALRMTIAAALVAVIGIGISVYGLTSKVPVAGATYTPSTVGTTVPQAAPDPAALALSRSLPVKIQIPAIHVSAPIMQVGRDPDGEVQVPPLGVHNLTGWYKYGPTPGETGASVILGHVDSYQGLSVFYYLKDLVQGDQISVTLADGITANFVVDGLQKTTKTDFPTRDVYGNVSYPGLRLVTCGGAFDSSTGHYLDNIIVYAHLVHSATTAAATGP